MVEVNKIVSIFSLLLCVITTLSIRQFSLTRNIPLLLGILFVSYFFILHRLPIMMIWILLCLLKMILNRNWRIALLIFTSFFLPAITGVGSPSYTIFVQMICLFVTVKELDYIENKISEYFKFCYFIPVILSMTFILIKCEVNLPVVSKMITPLLAEKEKTFQMKKIIDWFICSEKTNYKLMFSQDADDPCRSKNALNRKYRPPTQERYLSKYVNYLKGETDNIDDRKALIISFGNEVVSGEKLYIVHGKYNGDAVVYEK